MTNMYSLNSNVKFPNMEYYDMDKVIASAMQAAEKEFGS